MKITFSLILILALALNSVALKHEQTTPPNTNTTTANNTYNNTTQPNTNAASGSNTFTPTSNTKSVLPLGWGVAESESYYKNISNLNGPKKNWIIGDQKIDDYQNALYKFITANNITKCPQSTPYVKLGGGECFDCTGEKPIFDLKQGVCTSCPPGTTLDTENHVCVSSKCKGLYIWNESQQKCVCPAAYPIDLGCDCVTCLQPFAWNNNEKTCKLRCPETYEWNNSTQRCSCPQSTYEINGQCISCSLPFEWNSQTNQCDFKKDLKCNVQGGVQPQPQPRPQPQPSYPTRPVNPQPSFNPQPVNPQPSFNPQPVNPQPSFNPQPVNPQPSFNPQPVSPQPSFNPQPVSPQPTPTGPTSFQPRPVQ